VVNKIEVDEHLWVIHHKTTERHLPHGITQCYLSPDTGERALP